jgi:hypothetical protein
MVVNRLQANKLTEAGDGSEASNCDHITTAARHDHKLLFPTYDGKDDPLPLLENCKQPWLNWCARFFHIQATEDVGKVFLVSFYMMGDATQWFTLLEKNIGTPTWEDFEKLVNQRFSPPI